MAPVDPTSGVDSTTPGTTLPDRSSVLALAAALRTSLRFHNQMGIEVYPLTSGLAPSPIKGRKASEPKESGRPAVPVTPPARREHVATLGKSALGRATAGASARYRGLPDVCPGIRPAGGSDRQRYSGLVSAGGRRLFQPGCGLFSRQPSLARLKTHAVEHDAGHRVDSGRRLCDQRNEVLSPSPRNSLEIERVHCCREHLLREIELVRPRIICAMGEWAADRFWAARSRSSGCAADSISMDGQGAVAAQVMVTFHPRLLLKNAELKKAAWQDLQMIQRQLQASQPKEVRLSGSGNLVAIVFETLPSGHPAVSFSSPSITYQEACMAVHEISHPLVRHKLGLFGKETSPPKISVNWRGSRHAARL